MNRVIERAKWFFLIVFAVAAAAVWAHQIYYVQPKERCEARGDWWSPELRVCRTPVLVQDWRGKKLPPVSDLKPTLPPREAPAKAQPKS